MAEQFSTHGVPVFAADVKGDLSGIAVKNDGSGSQAFPVTFWDLFGERGQTIQTSVQEMGADMLGAMLGLNDAQAGALAIAFKVSEDNQEFMLTLDDLRYTLIDMIDNREDICQQYGNITATSITTIQRKLMAIESRGGEQLFGEPGFSIDKLLKVADDGRGVINLLHADELTRAPKLYAIFLLWLMSRLFIELPEAGDLDKPKLVFFFDEGHLLFNDAPKALITLIEQIVRLVRSKGVGVYFVTQTQKDVPEMVLGQLGNRIQHALRAYTPKDQKYIKAAASSFRPNPDINVADQIVTMAVGEALVSFLQEDGSPSIVEKIKVEMPHAQIGPISDLERKALLGRELIDLRGAKDIQGQINDHWKFRNRMRAQRGLEALPEPEPYDGEIWKECVDYGPIEVGERPSVIGSLFSIAWWGSLTFLFGWFSWKMFTSIS